MRYLLVKMEKLIHSVLAILLALYYRNRTLNILDLDNTLVDTRKFQVEKGRINVFDDASFPSLSSRAKNFCANCMKESTTIVLTARPYKSMNATIGYLRRETDLRLFLICRTASLKVTYLNQLNKFCKKVNYYDDLSYGVTEIKLYDSLINRVTDFERIHYYGLEYINKNILCD